MTIPVTLLQNALLCIVTLTVLSMAPKASFGGTTDLEAKVRLWEYPSLCEFRDPPNWPKTLTISKGTQFLIVGCEDENLRKQGPHPDAVRLTLENTQRAQLKFPFGGLGSVTLRSSDGKTTPPVGMRWRLWNPLGSGYISSFVTQFTGLSTISLEPGEVVDLMFLFPKAQIGDMLQVGKMDPIPIRAVATALPAEEPAGAVVIEVDGPVMAAVERLGAEIVFFTSRARPLKSLGELAGGNDVGIWGLELWEGVKAVLRAAGVEPGERVSLMGDGSFSEVFFARKPPLRLFVTHAYKDGRERQISEKGGGVRLVFRQRAR